MSRPSHTWQLQFALTSAIWGSSFLFIKVLDRHWPALWVAFGRILLGAVTLALLVVLRRERFPTDRRLWLHSVVAAALFNAVPFSLFAFGEKHVSSVMAGLWNATTPLWVLVVLLLAFPEERPTRRRLVGIGTGFLGVALLLGPWRGLGGESGSGIWPAPPPPCVTGWVFPTPGGIWPAGARVVWCSRPAS